ncbi:MAG: hypothetical protein RLZZ393_2163 [Pseudomonadota bacterium]
MNLRHRPTGFTLVEVLVALFIVALGMGALMATLAASADATAALRNRSLAQWIALNRISETRLSAVAPSTGRTEGEVEYAGSRWHWTQEVSDPGIAGILRIESRVAAVADPTSYIATATGFYGLSVAAPNGSLPDWSTAGAAPPPPNPGTPAPATPPAEVAR